MPVNSATYTHTCTRHTHSLTHMHTSMHVEACMHKHTCMCMHIHTHLQMCAHIFTLTHRCAYGMHTCAHTCTYSCDCTHVHTYTHVHMQTHALNGRLGQILALLAHLSFVSLIRWVPPEGPPSPLPKVVMPAPHGILSSLPRTASPSRPLPETELVPHRAPWGFPLPGMLTPREQTIFLLVAESWALGRRLSAGRAESSANDQPPRPSRRVGSLEVCQLGG